MEYPFAKTRAGRCFSGACPLCCRGLCTVTRGGDLCHSKLALVARKMLAVDLEVANSAGWVKMKRFIVFSLALASLFSPSVFAHDTTSTTGHGQAAKAPPVEQPPSIVERKVLYWYDPMHPVYK